LLNFPLVVACPYTGGMVRPPDRRVQHQRSGRNIQAGAKRIGLARILSKMGFCSRSTAVELIRAGRVTLNGALCRDPETPVLSGRDRIGVDGRPVQAATKVYFILNKPRGVVTTASDEKGRQTVYDLLSGLTVERARWLAPVGRLDKASEGLLLLTNDSEWADRITSPATHLDKTYHVQIGATADEPLLAALKQGVHSDGETLRAREIRILRRGQRNTWLEVVLDEGKNRHIRRMLDALGVDVLRLVRVAIGPLALGDLPKGITRPLTTEEKHSLDVALRRKIT
jgi:23S rRNA pseudouridine2605 synthase